MSINVMSKEPSKFKIGIVGFALTALMVIGLISPGFSAEVEDVKQESKKESEKLISFNFQDTDIDVVLQFFSEVADLTIIKGDKVRGKVTVIGSAKLPVSEALDVLQAILEVKGFTMVRSGKIMKIVAQTEATRKRIETHIGRKLEDISPEDKVITQIIPLEYVAASDMKAILGGLIFAGGTIIANERTNTLVIIDVASNIERLVKIIEQLDVEVREENVVIEIVPLEYADEVKLSNTLKQVFAQRQKKAKRPRKERELTGISKEILRGVIGEVTIIPDERLHSLIVITAETNMEVVKALINKLDVESPPSADNIRVFPLQNGKAEEVAGVLNELFASMGGKEKATRPRKVKEKVKLEAAEEMLGKEGIGTLEGTVKVVADKRTNSLIITTLPQNFPTIKRLLEKLDVRSPQVLIKALIAEVTLTDETKFGIEWKYSGKWSSSSDITGEVSATWGLSSFIAEGFKYSILKEDEDLNALIQALAKNTEFNILSAPCVLASDNEEAKIKIGESIPILKDVSYTETSGTVKSYDYKDVAIELTVTPTINKNKDVALIIHQVINKISAYDAELNAPILATRESQTSVVVKDRQVIVIGGLMRDDKTKVVSKIPLLGDIPILGLFFRKHHTEVQKTELLVFITPYVITNPEDADAMTKREVRKSKKISLRLEQEGLESEERKE